MKTNLSHPSSGDIIAAIEAGETELRIHPDQETCFVQVRKIFNYFSSEGLLGGCVDLEELRIIQSQGIGFFRKHFANKAVVAWRGVQGELVPYLVGRGGEVVLNWFHLDIGVLDELGCGLRRR